MTHRVTNLGQLLLRRCQCRLCLYMLLQMSTASGRSGLNGQTVHNSVTSVNELELASVLHRAPKTPKK